MSRLFPDAPIYTTFYDPSQTYPAFAELNVIPSRLNRIGFFRRDPRRAFLLLPLLVMARKVRAHQVLVSSSGWAHGFRTTGHKLVYCYTPARWLYQSSVYLDGTALPIRLFAVVTRFAMTRWDRRAARSCESYVAISTAVQRRIEEAYGRESVVVPAPRRLIAESIRSAHDHVDTEGSYFLCVSRLLQYKNVMAVLDAFEHLGQRLVLVGDGPLRKEVSLRVGDNVSWLHGIDDDQLGQLYAGAEALIAVSFEDFGLTPLEAAQFGTPSIALRWGGFLDTILENVTGMFISEPTSEAIAAAVVDFDSAKFDRDTIIAHSLRFTEASFGRRLRSLLSDLDSFSEAGG